MTWKRKTEVLVVGAGPVGLHTALRLAEAEVGVRIIDEQFQTAGQSYALALHPGSLRELADVGLLDELVEVGHRVESVAFYEGAERRATLGIGQGATDPPFVLVLPQSTLESALERRLRGAGAKVQWNHQLAGLESQGAKVVGSVNKLAKVSTGYAVATTEWVVQKTIPVEADFVVGADGHRSGVRRAAGIDFDPVGGRGLFAVFEFHSDTEPGSEATVVLDEFGTSVLWPLPDGRWRWSFQIPEGEGHEGPRRKSRLAVQIGRGSFPHVAEEELALLIADRAPWFEAPVTGVRWSMAIRFEHRLARCFGRERLWLAGDAAHLAGPVGAHSMNVGLREGRLLAEALAATLREQGVSGHLGTYGHRRLEEWRRLLGIDASPEVTEGAEPWVTRHREKILSCLPASGAELERLAAEIGLSLGGGTEPH
jgi:2-polyprenyl-6-methoxyphenol hydroxylase-like FAD-dependent oxidoreductase